MAAILKTKDLTKKYGNKIVVDNLNLEIEEGELFSLLGVNGAGKTTTVKMLSGLTVPTAGDAEVCGFSVVKEPDRVKGSIDVSMQETAIVRKLTVEEKIEEDKKYVYSVFGLDSVAKRYAGKLSGGWQRKLSVALALISRPKVLFLDEPTLGLDVIARRELWRTIRELKGKMTVILTTHYMEEAEALSDRIGVMKDGKLLFVGTQEEMYASTGKGNVEEAFIEIVTGGERDA